MTTGKNVLWDAASDCTKTGTLVTVRVRIGEKAEAGENILKVKVQECFNEAGGGVASTVTAVKFNVLGEPLPPEPEPTPDPVETDNVNTTEPDNDVTDEPQNGGEQTEGNKEPENGGDQPENGSTSPENEETRPENGVTDTENGESQSENGVTEPENGGTEIVTDENGSKPQETEGKDGGEATDEPMDGETESDTVVVIVRPTPAPEDSESEKNDGTASITDNGKKGCGSSVGFGAIALVSAACAAVALKKKEN
jgi:hypothetical protein